METIIGDVTADASRRPVTQKTLAEPGFYWREHGGLRLLVCKALEDAGFANGFSTRLGGVSPFPSNDLNLAGFDDDTAENISENRRRFLELFEPGFVLSTAWQVHGHEVKVIDSADAAARTDERFDALVSDLRGLLLGVKTADCVPVLIGDPVTGAYAAVHAGWRGTVESIAARAVRKMSSIFSSDPSDLICAIGPAACGRDYEVGSEVIKEFERNFRGSETYFSETRPGHALVDLHLANRDQLTAAGVPSENVSVSSLCTMERTDLFFSYRMEKKLNGRTGRLLSVIGRIE